MRNWNWRWGFPIAAVAVLVASVWINGDTPFRGEHWGLLLSWIRSGSLGQGLQNIATFHCLAEKRFQPLAFFPNLISYGLFRDHFLLHYACSVTLHVLTTIYFLRFLNLTQSGGAVSDRRLFLKYPIETALFLGLFAASEVILWSFFHYLQLAVLLSLMGTWIFTTRNELRQRRLLGLALVLAAALIYEPFLILFLLLLGANAVRFKGESKVESTLGVTILLTLGCIYLYRSNAVLSLTYQWLTPEEAVASKWNMPALLSGLLTNAVRSLFAGGFAHKHDIYYFKPYFSLAEWFHWILVGWIIFSILLLRQYLKLPRERKGFSQIVVGAFLCIPAIASLIVVGRLNQLGYAAKQFRYFYVIMPFLLVGFLGALRAICWNRWPRRIYEALVVIMVIANLSTTFVHANQVASDMLPLAELASEMKKVHYADTVIQLTARALIEKKLEVSGIDADFLYNAHACNSSWWNGKGE